MQSIILFSLQVAQNLLDDLQHSKKTNCLLFSDEIGIYHIGFVFSSEHEKKNKSYTIKC